MIIQIYLENMGMILLRKMTYKKVYKEWKMNLSFQEKFCLFLALRAYLWVKSVAEMPVKPLHC